MLKNFLIFYLIFNFQSVKSQDWQIVKSIPFSETITAVGNDINGLIYLGSSDGKLIRIDPFTSKTDQFSLSNMSAISYIDAWNSLKIFIFLVDNQEYMYLDRFIADFRRYNVPENSNGITGFVLPAPDHSIWVLEQPQLQLSKYNDANQKLINTVPLTLSLNIEEITYARAFQNLLLVAEKKNGLLIFDSFGNLIKQFPLNQIQSILITSDLAFVLHEGGLLELQLTVGGGIINHYIPDGYQYGMRVKSDFILINSKKLDVLQLK